MELLKAPERGMLYALYTDRMEYRPYEREDLPLKEELQKNLLELHLFDEKKEYRFIKKRKRKTEIEEEGTEIGEEIEVVVSDEEKGYDDLYIERIFTQKDEKEKNHASCIEVVNYLGYDENDLLKIKNYRLKEVKA